MLGPQRLHHLAGRSYRVVIANGLKVFVIDQSVELGTQSEDADFQSLALEDDVGFDEAVELRTCEVVVGTEDGKVEAAEDPCHIVESEVELMVADGSGVIVHEVHQSALHIALVESIVGRPLREVARIEEQQIGILGTLLLDHSHTPHEASAARRHGVAQHLRERENRAMCVVGMKDGQHLLFLRPCAHGGAKQQGDNEYGVSFVHESCRI